MEQHDWHCQTYAAWLFSIWHKPEYWHDNDNIAICDGETYTVDGVMKDHKGNTING